MSRIGKLAIKLEPKVKASVASGTVTFEGPKGKMKVSLPERITADVKDGQIHVDSKDKILTGLLYLNPHWAEAGGRLRLLRNGKDIEAYALEVPPAEGNMVVFRRSDRSWHGHLPSEGRRLSLQFNWVSGEGYARRELARHRFSGWMKRLTGQAQA